MKDRNWRRIASERGSVFVEYALLASVLTVVAVAAFTPAGGGVWAGSQFGNDYVIREILIGLPYF